MLCLRGRHFIRRLVLFQPMKTSHDMAEKWLTGTKESNRTKMMYNSIHRDRIYIYVIPCKWNLKAVQALENLLKSLIYERMIFRTFLIICTL